MLGRKGRLVAERNFTPRYYEIQQKLRQRISNAQPGDALPSDSELCEEFGVSRMTVRAAVRDLVQEGLVHREPGRGTFVAQQLVHRRLSQLTSFSEEMRRRGMVPSSEVIDAGVRPATEIEAKALKLPAGAEVVFLHRVRLADDAPMAVELSVLPGKCAPVVDRDMATSSLHRVLVELGHVPSSGRSTLTAETTTAGDARLLRLARRAPLLVERRVIQDDLGQPLEYTESRYASERYRLDIEFIVHRPPV